MAKHKLYPRLTLSLLRKEDFKGTKKKFEGVVIQQKIP